MDRTEFEALRDLPGKVIEGDVRLVATPRAGLVLAADDILIRNKANTDLILNITYLPERRGLKLNVHARGIGAICRLEVNCPEHPDATRTHKHALQTARCPGRNLPHAHARPDLRGKTIRQVWTEFCEVAAIHHNGQLFCEGVDPSTEIL